MNWLGEHPMGDFASSWLEKQTPKNIANSWDEISLKKDLTWQPNLLEWHGVVDYGPKITGSTQTGIASHCLVFLFQPYLWKWIQPIACRISECCKRHFTSRDSDESCSTSLQPWCSGRSTVCDGCSSNKSVMSMFGVRGDGSDEQCISSFPHPMDPNINIYWFIDVPHLLKVLTGNLIKIQLK